MAHLLVVDDEPSISELLEISFRKEGHKVEVVSNGQAAKRRLAAQVFDIVISDICMPDMDGETSFEYCRSSTPFISGMQISEITMSKTCAARRRLAA